MKRSELFFAAVLVPIDFFMLLLAGSLAYYLRVSPWILALRPAVFVLDLPFLEYLPLVVIVSIFIVGIFALQGLYAMQVTRRLYDEVIRIFTGVSMGVMAVIVYIFLSAELFQSRFILLAAYVFALGLVSLGRWAMRDIQIWLLRRGFGVHRVVLVGNGHLAGTLASIFLRKPYLGYRVVAAPATVNLEHLKFIRKKDGIDEVIKTDPTMSVEDNLLLLEFCDKYKIDFQYIPDLFETYAPHIRFRQIAGVPLMQLVRTPLDGWGRIAKRVMDIFGSLIGLVILSVLFLLTALFIRLDSPGSIFYRQKRVGRNTKMFYIYKFRTMYQEDCLGEKYGGKKAAQFEKDLRAKMNERSGPLFKMKDDPRITRIGRILRRTRIDELPQLFNVLRGEMSLLGPRPHLPKEVKNYDKHHYKLFTIKPGMSGMAQVNGNAGLPFEQEAKLDIGYIENWSLWLDIVLLLKTFKILFTDRNAV